MAILICVKGVEKLFELLSNLLFKEHLTDFVFRASFFCLHFIFICLLPLFTLFFNRLVLDACFLIEVIWDAALSCNFFLSTLHTFTYNRLEELLSCFLVDKLAIALSLLSTFALLRNCLSIDVESFKDIALISDLSRLIYFFDWPIKDHTTEASSLSFSQERPVGGVVPFLGHQLGLEGALFVRRLLPGPLQSLLSNVGFLVEFFRLLGWIW